MDEWEAEHPGKIAEHDMDPTEFSERVMAKIMATAEIAPIMPPHPRKQ
jgi:hypothetical protein